MRTRIRALVPRRIRGPLGDYYRALFGDKKAKLTARNWSLPLNVPPELKQAFTKSVFEGTLDVPIDSVFRSILLCAQPKSASLYLTQLLALSLGYDNHQIGFDSRGGNVYFPRLIAARFRDRNTISHCHAEPTTLTLKMIKTLGLQPIVLTRNLVDTLVSRRDMMVRDGWANEMLPNKAVGMFMNGSDTYQMDVIIELFATKFINFYTGWEQLKTDHAIKPIFISYEEMIADEPALICRVAKAIDHHVSRPQVEKISSEIRGIGGINFNKGVIGRGREHLTEGHIDDLRRKARMLECHNEEYLGFSL